MTNAEQRMHLKHDVRIADENAVRYADAAMPRVGFDGWVPVRLTCTDSLYAIIQSRHGVTRRTINAAAHMRDGWIDTVLVWLPSAVLFVAGVSMLLRRVLRRRADPPSRWEVAVLLLWLGLTVSGVGVGVAHFWGWTVEEWRLRTHHLSFRARYLPVGSVVWRAYAGALALFAVVAAYQVRAALARWSVPSRVNSLDAWKR